MLSASSVRYVLFIHNPTNDDDYQAYYEVPHRALGAQHPEEVFEAMRTAYEAVGLDLEHVHRCEVTMSEVAMRNRRSAAGSVGLATGTDSATAQVGSAAGPVLETPGAGDAPHPMRRASDRACERLVLVWSASKAA